MGNSLATPDSIKTNPITILKIWFKKYIYNYTLIIIERKITFI